jgi:pSer/pThr/pTyr-binding forkhead associated (FHA) protein
VRGGPAHLHSATPAELIARNQAERRGTPFLVYRDDADRQQLVDLNALPRRLAIGRRPDCEIAVEWDGEASRIHAELEEIAGEWTVVDDGRSRNGTFLNGKPVHGRKRLADGDVITVGRTLLMFRWPTASPAWETTTLGSSEPLVVSPAQKRVLLELCRPYAEATGFATPASNRDIAHTLVVSNETVKGHMRALFEIFGIRDLPQNQKRAMLARSAIETGLITIRDLEAPRVHAAPGP